MHNKYEEEIQREMFKMVQKNFESILWQNSLRDSNNFMQILKEFFW